MPYLGVVVGTVLLLMAIKKGVNVGLAAVVAGIVTAGLGGHGSLAMIRSFRETVMDPDGFALLASVGLITMLGSIMKVSGTMSSLVHGINCLVDDTRWVVFLVPSLIGLVSAPGGAVFSAPLVDVAGSALGMSEEHKVVANIMFRRAWHYVYPISTAMLLTRQMANVPYLAFLLPGCVAATVVILTTTRLVFGRQRRMSGLAYIGTSGVLPAVHQSQRMRSGASANGVMIGLDDNSGTGTWPYRLELVLSLLTSAAPILVVLVVYLVTTISLPIAVCLGCVAGILLAEPGEGYWKHVGRRFREALARGIDWRVVGTVAGTVFFGHSISNSLAWKLSSSNMSPGILSLLAFGVIIPALAGFVIGSHTAALGVALPLLLPLISGLPASSGLVVALFMSSFAGHLVSPANVCFTATVEYLEADFAESWRLLLIPSLMGFLFTLVFWTWQVSVNLA